MKLQRYLTLPIVSVFLAGSTRSAHALNIKDYFKPATYFSDFPSIINVLLPNLMLLAGIILFIIVIIAGFQMVATAGSGDAKAAEQWKTTLTYSIAGFLLIVFSYAIIKLIDSIWGINILNPNFDPNS